MISFVIGDCINMILMCPHCSVIMGAQFMLQIDELQNSMVNCGCFTGSSARIRYLIVVG